ncbi:hypothetical protein PAMA_006307 [Pampus argenteus]
MECGSWKEVCDILAVSMLPRLLLLCPSASQHPEIPNTAATATAQTPRLPMSVYLIGKVRRKSNKHRQRLEHEGKGKEWNKRLECFQHHGELRHNICYITAVRTPTNPHFSLRWPSRRLCCRCASSLVTLIGFPMRER